jgi:hypothetical protein
MRTVPSGTRPASAADPAPVGAEVGCLLAAPAERRSRVPSSARSPSRPSASSTSGSLDYKRMAELVDTYADSPFGTADAAVTAVVERLRITEVATLDHHHFRAVRPRHIPAFTPLP